jgi:mannosyl-3-phosphoglycerate synthase
MAHPTAAKHGVEVFQIETRNPHLHEERGGQHLEGMLLPGLGAIYHSQLCEEETRQMILGELRQQNAIKPDEEPPKPQLIAPPKNIELQKFAKVIEEQMPSYSALENV